MNGLWVQVSWEIKVQFLTEMDFFRLGGRGGHRVHTGFSAIRLGVK